MLRGYDLNSADQILKDEESNFPLNHLNPRVQHLDSYHHYLHPHPNFAGVRRGSSSGSSPPNRHKHSHSKYTTDPHASNGISLKPIYLPRPVANAMPVNGSSNHSNSPTNDSGRLVSQSLYPYNLARLSPSERNRVFYQKRIPGGANILVNDAWMVLPLDPVRRNSCYSCSSSVREDRSVCDGCRRHSCPVDHPMTLDQTMDRNSSSSRGSRDSYTNNNNRNESNLNQKMNMNNNSQHHAYPNQRSSPAKKSNNNSNSKYNNDTEKSVSPVKSSIVVNDVTDTKL